MINKKAQSLGLSIISAIAIILVGFLALNFLPGEVTTARLGLDCTNAEGIEDGNKLLCLAIDAVIPYWIYIIMAVALGAVVIRFAL